PLPSYSPAHSRAPLLRALSSPLSLFLTLTPRPPTPTLFPYTTLFRSDNIVITVVDRPLGATYEPIENSVTRLGPIPTPATTSTTDRKSTRLNSSHVSISYAVFCLKKKITEFA